METANYNNIPDIELSYNDEYNPTIKSPNCPYELSFFQTKSTLMDISLYKKFLHNSISRFRRSATYKNYKRYLCEVLGMNRCQVMSNIDSDMADIEMHHNFITIFDIALLITEHVINTKGYICTFDLVQLLKEEHKANRIPIVMLSKTVHQMYHNNPDFVLPARMCVGYWQELLIKYNKGITLEIANKCVNFIQKSIEMDQNMGLECSNKLLGLRNDLIDWSTLNQYGESMMIEGPIYDEESDDSYRIYDE